MGRADTPGWDQVTKHEAFCKRVGLPDGGDYRMFQDQVF